MENILEIIIGTVRSAFEGVQTGVSAVFGALKDFFSALFPSKEAAAK